MSQIQLDIPDDMLLALKVTEHQLAEELKMIAAVKLYELGRLSSGAAAQLAGIPRCLFLTRLGDYGVATFRLSEEELRRDLEMPEGSSTPHPCRTLAYFASFPVAVFFRPALTRNDCELAESGSSSQEESLPLRMKLLLAG